MMPNLRDIYNQAFFEEWGPANAAYVGSARVSVEVLLEEIAPRRLIDLGCGCGLYSHLFEQAGVDVVAVDGACPQCAYDVPIHPRDLTVPFENVWGPFDVTLCLEVAEHIPESLVDPFLDNVTRFSDLLIMSAAQPGQGGHHHVNEQPKRYWVQRLAEKGFLYDRRCTGRLMETFKRRRPPLMWMVEHISIYRRRVDTDPVPGPLPFAVSRRARRRS